MSRYDDPEGMGDYPEPGRRRMGPLGRRDRGEDTGSWGTGGPGRRDRASGRDPQTGPGRSGRQRRPERQDRPGRQGRPERQGRTGPVRRHPVLGAHPVLGLAAIISTVLVVGVSLIAYAAVRNVYDGINHETITAQMLGHRPPKLNGSTNILLIGSDSRAGTKGYGSFVQGSRSDTSMLLHISPDHAHAYVISFPRDSMVPVYGCLSDHQGHPGQSAAPGSTERLNATFSDGGAPCLWKTLEQTTHIRIDHFVEVGFGSFKTIVNDVHGIDVCLPFPIRNWRAHLYLSAGRHKVYGAQALAFVRLRENIGDGSDLERIQRQQIFLASAMQKIKQTNLLGDYKVLADAAHAVTTDLTLTNMLSIANAMKSLNPSSLRFITVPVVPDPLDPAATVDWAQPQADTLFSALSHDNHIYKAVKAARGAGKKKGKSAATVSPSQVQLEVLNGSGTAGLAGTTATGLSGRGFNVIGTGDAANFTYANSVIQYSSASQIPEVNTLKKEVPGAQVQKASGLQAGTIALVIGSKFAGLTGGKAKKGPSVATLNTSNYQTITANQNICKDNSAFSGPLSPVPSPSG